LEGRCTGTQQPAKFPITLLIYATGACTEMHAESVASERFGIRTGLGFGAFRDQADRLHCDLTIVATLSCALARARVLSLAAWSVRRGYLPGDTRRVHDARPGGACARAG